MRYELRAEHFFCFIGEMNVYENRVLILKCASCFPFLFQFQFLQKLFPFFSHSVARARLLLLSSVVHGELHCRFNGTIHAKYACASMAKSFVGGKNAVSFK